MLTADGAHDDDGDNSGADIDSSVRVNSMIY